MKRFVALVGMMVALGWSGAAFAQTTSCASLSNFICAYSAAETMSLVTSGPSKAGQPDVYLGYLAFNSTGASVTMTGTSDIDGKVNTGINLTGTCTDGASGQPGTIALSDSSQLSFVIDSSSTELQFILTKDPNTSSTSTAANSVRVGVCRKQ
jgi:hypothetical protein